jgi:hypothetical protein
LKTKILLTTAFLFTAGCINKPISFSEAKTIPTERVYAFQNKGEVTLLITRDKGMQGAGCNTRFYINETLAAEFAQGERYSFKVPSGALILGIEPSAACGGGLRVEREINGKPGDTIRSRIFISSTHIDIMPTAIH